MTSKKILDSGKIDSSKEPSSDPISLPDPAPKKAKKASDLSKKYPSRTLEDLRNIDFVNQYQSRFPNIKVPGHVVIWPNNTPEKNMHQQFYNEGYDFVPAEYFPNGEVETVPSGYADHTGEGRYDHVAMMMPQEIFDKKQKALEAMRSARFDHILKPKKDGTRLARDESGMYDPEGRSVKIVNKVLTKEE